MRKLYCKYHNWFLSTQQIKERKQNRCYNCKYLIRIGGVGTKGRHYVSTNDNNEINR